MVARPQLLLTALLVACAGGGGEDTATVTTLDGLTTRRWSAESGPDGLHAVPVDVAADESAMLVCGVGWEPDIMLSVERVEAPGGAVALDWEDWYWSERQLTSAFFPVSPDTCVNWPVRARDGVLTAGTWTVYLATTTRGGDYRGERGLDVVAQTRQDPGADGALDIALTYGGDLADDPALVAAVEGALERWADIWGDAGVDIVVTVVATDLPADLPSPASGHADWTAAAARTTDADVLVAIGDTVGDRVGLYGEAGSIPGSLTASRRAAVAISWLANAGADAAFDDDEVRLLGETIAHEVGHHAGLVHPVEESWDWWDALDDTPECTTLRTCESDLGDNLMFPYAICGLGSCFPQGALTEEQAVVLANYTGVR